jgi:hypoxanthine phosphoribosyltransferase
MNKILRIGWTEFLAEIAYLADGLQKDKRFEKIENIYAIPRGGLIIGVILSHRLNIPMIFDGSKINKHTLVVDDISDTGNTLSNLITDKKALTAVVCQKMSSKLKADFFVRYVGEDEWVKFPFETITSSKKDN